MFENNPYYVNIKRELGFYDDSSCLDSSREIFSDTKARSSPVVERLILEEIQNTITEHAANLNIAIGEYSDSTLE